ncbi:DASH complex subunit DAD1 [Beauveria bassiana]|nr:DASH complex subunit DAD1 [Beauveria bassiana]KAH8713400.1 DASH complex subunit DAD1 [Beauveria bassiana]
MLCAYELAYLYHIRIEEDEMASSHRGASAGPSRDKSYFEQQREALLGDIAMSFEQVLGNINKLNRSLESIIAVGNEFSSVETLWSQFENVMGKDEAAAAAAAAAARQSRQGGDEQPVQSQQQQGSGSSGSRGVKREAQSDVENE